MAGIAKHEDLYLDDGEGGQKEDGESKDGQNNSRDSRAGFPPKSTRDNIFLCSVLEWTCLG